MATVHFYEKPGCINNTRQKQLLAAAGHQVIAQDLLTKTWEKHQLRLFFGDKPVSQWFNYSAPAIKLGDIQPDNVTEDEALTLMLENPLLIKRPLMQVGDEFMAGFDQLAVDNWIGLKEIQTNLDIETCPKKLDQANCHHE